MTTLFRTLYGPDSLKYEYITGQGTRVCEDNDPRDSYHYDHSTWENKFREQFVKNPNPLPIAHPSDESSPLENKVRTCLAVEKDV